MNKPTGFACRCVSGWTVNGLNGCDNLNECLAQMHNCPETAVCQEYGLITKKRPRSKSAFRRSEIRSYKSNPDKDTVGSFECECFEGFKGELCEDVNECEDESKWSCEGGKENKICVNDIGGYYCQCVDGYKEHIVEGRLKIDSVRASIFGQPEQIYRPAWTLISASSNIAI